MSVRSIPAAVAVLLVFSCSDNSSEPAPAEPEALAGIDEVIEIGIGRSAFIVSEGLIVEFADVTDSRCPRGAMCLWEGEGTAKLVLRTLDGREEIATPVIRPGKDPGRHTWLADYALGFRITLAGLEPYPSLEKPAHRSQYRAALIFEKVGDPAPCLDVEFDANPASRCADGLWIDGVSILEGRLIIAVRYAGGCGEHEFALVAGRYFAKSDPPRMDCWLVHRNLGDPCEAIVTGTACFDLRRIGELCDGLFGGCSEIVIGVGECDPADPGEVRTVTWRR